MTSLLFLLVLAGDLDAAEKALEKGEHRQAIELLGDLADREDPDIRALIVLGRAFLGLREYEGAVDPLLSASDARPDDKELARDAAWACWGAASGQFARAYIDDARRYAKRSRDPLLVADLDHAATEFEAALEGYRALDKKTLHVATRIAECLAGLGRDAEAKEAYGVALEEAIRTGNLDAGWRTAFAGEKVGRLLTWLDTRVADAPDDFRARLYRGYARATLLMYREAVEDLRWVVKSRPDYDAGKARLCLVLLQWGAKQQRPDALAESERLARELLARDSRQRDALDALSFLASYAWSNRDVPRSYALLKHLRGLDPEDRITALNFGAMARRLGHYGEAVEAFDVLLAIDPEDPDVLNDYGILKDAMGDRAAAVALWKRVLQVEDDNLNAMENLFTHSWEQGDQTAARAYLVRGLEAARRRGDEGLVGRWSWFRDRLLWASNGFGG